MQRCHSVSGGPSTFASYQVKSMSGGVGDVIGDISRRRWTWKDVRDGRRRQQRLTAARLGQLEWAELTMAICQRIVSMRRKMENVTAFPGTMYCRCASASRSLRFPIRAPIVLSTMNAVLSEDIRSD